MKEWITRQLQCWQSPLSDHVLQGRRMKLLQRAQRLCIWVACGYLELSFGWPYPFVVVFSTVLKL